MIPSRFNNALLLPSLAVLVTMLAVSLRVAESKSFCNTFGGCSSRRALHQKAQSDSTTTTPPSTPTTRMERFVDDYYGDEYEDYYDYDEYEDEEGGGNKRDYKPENKPPDGYWPENGYGHYTPSYGGGRGYGRYDPHDGYYRGYGRFQGPKGYGPGNHKYGPKILNYAREDYNYRPRLRNEIRRHHHNRIIDDRDRDGWSETKRYIFREREI